MKHWTGHEAAVDQEDYGPFEKLLEVLSSPYEEN